MQILRVLQERSRGAPHIICNGISRERASSASIQWNSEDGVNTGIETQHHGFAMDVQVAAVALNNIHLSSEYMMKLKTECEVIPWHGCARNI